MLKKPVKKTSVLKSAPIEIDQTRVRGKEKGTGKLCKIRPSGAPRAALGRPTGGRGAPTGPTGGRGAQGVKIGNLH